MKTQNTRPVQQNIFIIYILSLLGLIFTVVWLNGMGFNRNSIPTETLLIPTIPLTIPKQLEKLTPKENPVLELQPKAYFLQVEKNKISLVPQSVTTKTGANKQAALTNALNQLFDTSQNNQLTSTIPPNTKLLGLLINEKGIHINLSDEFRYGGGSTSMLYRVAQVLYTASSIEESANVYLSIEGELLNEENPLGGEGLILAEPLTRQKFVEDFSIN